MKIYLKSPEDNKIIEFQNANEIGTGFVNYQPATEQEIITFLFEKAKQSKLTELNTFHDSKEVKYLIIKIGNLQTGIFVNQEYRYLIDEQRELLAIRKEAGEANPTWLYQNGVTLPLDLKTLNQIRLYIGKLTDDNFRAKANNIQAINNFKTIKELEKFDIKTNYRLNQILTF